ncbi:MAG: hypothetical protein HYS05_08500 [Acidobacteria bacterium]|nr:hypothetical protein [Acidobacteriota bacterium]
MTSRSAALFLATLAAFTASSIGAQNRPAAPRTPRIYVFEGGSIKMLDPKPFNFTREELKQTDFVVTSYLIVHPRGALMFDSGVIPDAAFKGDGNPVTQGGMSATKAERDAMFADKPQGFIQPAHFSALRDAKTRILDNEDFDVFGDGTVVVKSAPGHTPGHQVVFVKLAKTGPVVLGGDLYHYPEERTTGRIPITLEFNADQSRAARAKIEAFLKEMRAQLWIEHDIATHAELPKAPAYVD